MIPFVRTKKLPKLNATIHKFGGRWLGISKVCWPNRRSTWLFYFLRKTHILLETN